MLRCVEVRKSYTLIAEGRERRVEALRGVNLEIPGAGFHAIMGRSGSGKSTLLHLIAALDRPDSGEIVLNDRAIHGMSEREATLFRRTEIGIVFQQFNLVPTLTAWENVSLPGLLGGERADGLRARAEELLERLGLSGRGDHRPDALSGGEQQRVAIARSLWFRPRILFADEPTGNLDSQSSGALWRLLGELAGAEGMLVVMVTHEPAAAAHCERIHILQDGVVRDSIATEGLDASGVAARYQRSVGAA